MGDNSVDGSLPSANQLVALSGQGEYLIFQRKFPLFYTRHEINNLLYEVDTFGESLDLNQEVAPESLATEKCIRWELYECCRPLARL
ncbi:hypothetical protein CL176_01275 [Suicoccus acidiformans]|uniref:Uncharacterized protein n=2 Tax=Suicoccus acidiformans TaxID=2036206 RepID=A0A347WI48_9LACT|nr:hypothetical protein CL176_01275 [Suicoccus acidiformans]